jgi:hypothetical protein
MIKIHIQSTFNPHSIHIRKFSRINFFLGEIIKILINPLSIHFHIIKSIKSSLITINILFKNVMHVLKINNNLMKKKIII